jgi:processing peptidase subunit alpha
MGSADSFSSGGPGKGMYVRAYTNLMNRVQSVEKVHTFNKVLSDTGLFGLHIGGRNVE